MPVADLHKNTNELYAKVYKVDDYNKPVTDDIPNLETHKYNPTYKHWFWGGIDQIKSIGHHHVRARFFGFGEKHLRVIIYLMPFLSFIPKFYIETVLLTHTNNII